MNFHGLFTGQLYVPAAGDITFNQYVDDAWILGIGPKVGGSGEQPYYVSGTFDPPTPPAPTPSPITTFNGYLVVSRFQSGSGYTDLKQTTVHFPSAGYYPTELDYTECQTGQLEMVLGSVAANPIPNGATPTVTPVPTVLCVSSSDWCTSISANNIGHNELRGVAVISQDHIWAVGGYDIDMTTQSGHSLVEFWDNSTWHVVSTPDVGILNGIVAVGNSNSDIYAVGDTGILHYDGNTSTWSQVSGRPGGNGIGGGPSNVWVVGNPSQGIQLFDGAWHDYTDPDGATLNAVAVISSDNVTAVGYTGNSPNRRLHMAQWNGSTWSTVSGPSITTDSYYTGVDFYGKALNDENHLWAVGAYYYPGDDRYETLTVYGDGPRDSRTWRAIASPNPSTLDNRLNHVWLDTEGDVWAAGSYEKEDASGNNSLVMRWNDTNWAQVDSPAPGVSSELLGIATIPGNTAVVTSTWAVGSYRTYGSGPSQTLVEHIQAIQDPNTTVSYYENNLDASTLSDYYIQGCKAAARGASGAIVLDFGQPRNLGTVGNPRYGTKLIGSGQKAFIQDITPTPTGTPATPIDIKHAVEKFAKGYHDAYFAVIPPPNCPHVSGQVHSIALAVGVNNDLNPTTVPTVLPTPAVEIPAHAAAWGEMIKGIKYDLATYTEILAVYAAIDAEPSFDTGYEYTKLWTEAYNSTNVSHYYNFGSTDSYPLLPTGTPTPIVPPFVCCSAWTVDQLYHVSYGITMSLSLPEIYTPQYAREWNRVKRWSIESGQPAIMSFEGEMSECKSSPCGIGGDSKRYFNEEEAWRVFWLELNGDPDTRQFLTFSTDIKCSNGYTAGNCTIP